VNLTSSNAIGADFRNADLRNINLADADLTGAKLRGAKRDGAKYCNTLMPDGSVKNPFNGVCPGQADPAPTKLVPVP
jgi:uncharacterized protein YjbI with pentapeptide repeats